MNERELNTPVLLTDRSLWHHEQSFFVFRSSSKSFRLCVQTFYYIWGHTNSAWCVLDWSTSVQLSREQDVHTVISSWLHSHLSAPGNAEAECWLHYRVHRLDLLRRWWPVPGLLKPVQAIRLIWRHAQQVPLIQQKACYWCLPVVRSWKQLRKWMTLRLN